MKKRICVYKLHVSSGRQIKIFNLQKVKQLIPGYIKVAVKSQNFS